MIILNMKDGSTVKFNTEEDEQREQFNKLGYDPHKVKFISGLWVIVDKQRVTLPFPQKFRRVYFYCDIMRNKRDGVISGDQVVVQADDIRLLVTSYRSHDRMTRIDLRKTGKQVFIP